MEGDESDANLAPSDHRGQLFSGSTESLPRLDYPGVRVVGAGDRNADILSDLLLKLGISGKLTDAHLAALAKSSGFPR